MPEMWLPVVGHEGFYEVSDAGRVRSIDREFIRADGRRQPRRGRVLKPSSSGRGYPSVTLRFGARRTVHSLVCAAFHGPRPGPRHEAAHWNGDPTDNRSENLRWATQSENQQDSIRHGTKAVPPSVGSGEMNGNAKLRAEDVLAIRGRASAGESQRSLAASYRISKGQVYNIVHGKQWRQEWA